MKVNTFTKEEMHADLAEFHLLVLILKYAWEQLLRRMANEVHFHHQSVHNENATQMYGHEMWRAADQKVVVFLSHLPES